LLHRHAQHARAGDVFAESAVILIAFADTCGSAHD
jgi:hypothetical protein